jgi:heme A synthase
MSLVIGAIVVVFAVAVFFFIARRVLRVALKLAMVGVLLLLLLAGALFGWWRGWFSSGWGTERTPSTQRQNSNRRATPR